MKVDTYKLISIISHIPAMESKLTQIAQVKIVALLNLIVYVIIPGGQPCEWLPSGAALATSVLLGVRRKVTPVSSLTLTDT